ncbi:hypothetical protein EJB05_08409, partial [Eragrostis curvula]
MAADHGYNSYPAPTRKRGPFWVSDCAMTNVNMDDKESIAEKKLLRCYFCYRFWYTRLSSLAYAEVFSPRGERLLWQRDAEGLMDTDGFEEGRIQTSNPWR